MKKAKKTLFFFTDNKFKKYVQKNNPEIFLKSTFLKGLIFDWNKKVDFSDVEVLSIFIDIKLDKKTLKLFPNLKQIITRSTGIDHIDVDFCKKNNIEVLNIPEYGSQTVAEFALTLLLFLLRNLEHNKIAEHNRGMDLAGKTIGIVGAGKIGRNFIKLISAFGVKILISDPCIDKNFAKKYNAEYVDLKTLIESSDIISLHTPLCKSTYHLFGKTEFALLKEREEGIILINTSRGAVLDTKYLYKALKGGVIKKAGLDVLEEEENLTIKTTKSLSKKSKEILNLNKKIIKLKNVIYTKHQAYNTKEAVERIWETTLSYLKIK